MKIFDELSSQLLDFELQLNCHRVLLGGSYFAFNVIRKAISFKVLLIILARVPLAAICTFLSYPLTVFLDIHFGINLKAFIATNLEDNFQGSSSSRGGFCQDF
jgi:hypothetical protein